MGNKVTFASLIFLLLAFSAIPLSAQLSTSYLVTWTPNPEPDISGYVIYRSTSTNPDNLAAYVAIDSVGGSTFSYVDNGVVKGTRYYYRLVAKSSAGGRSGFSNPVSGKTIRQDASDTEKNACRITSKTKLTESSYNVGWYTLASSTGFLQYDVDQTLDSMSAWSSQSASTHTSLIDGLLVPQTYYLRAVSFDDTDNMTISAIDTLVTQHEVPAPVSTPNLSIYPVPYHPSSGHLNLTDMPADGSVSIIDGNGVEVWNARVNGQTSMTWNGVNRQGSPVMSGVYYAVIRDAKGTVIDKRALMIVR
jgi:hypothetical protein